MLNKISRTPHWQTGETLLLTHPGCLLSNQKPRATMAEQVRENIMSRRLTVLVTHWWEYFDGDQPDKTFIRILHETANWLADCPEIKVITFDELLTGKIPLF